MDEQRLKAIIGTLAHNSTFRIREIDEYTRFDPVPLSGLRVVKELQKRELLSMVEKSGGQNAYYPTRKGWAWIESE